MTYTDEPLGFLDYLLAVVDFGVSSVGIQQSIVEAEAAERQATKQKAEAQQVFDIESATGEKLARASLIGEKAGEDEMKNITAIAASAGVLILLGVLFFSSRKG